MSESPFVLAARGGWAEDAALARSGPPYGPRNTWSNLAYALVGCWLAWADQGASGAAMAVAMCFLATGSGLYHAFKNVMSNRLDWLGMYAVTGALVSHAYLPGSPVVPWVMLAVGGLLGFIYAKQLRWLSRDWHIFALMVLSSLPIYWRHEHRGLLGLAWAVFALAYACWHLDKRHSKLVGLWGHALWHKLTPISIGLLYWAGRP